MRIVLGVLLFGVLCAPAVALGPGSVDRSFGNGGIASERYGSDNPPVAVLTSGDVMVGLGNAAQRYSPRGREKPGHYMLGEGFFITTIAAMPDGGFVFGADYFGSVGLARYAADGTRLWRVDLPIGEQIDNGYPFATPLTIVPTADDKLLVGGHASETRKYAGDPFVARINAANGFLDQSFGRDGVAALPVPEDATGTVAVRTIGARDDGSMIAAGGAIIYPGSPILFELDATGSARSLGNAVFSSFAGILLQPDGGFVAGGIGASTVSVNVVEIGPDANSTGFYATPKTVGFPELPAGLVPGPGGAFDIAYSDGEGARFARVGAHGGRVRVDATGLRASGMAMVSSIAVQDAGHLIVAGQAPDRSVIVTRLFRKPGHGRVTARRAHGRIRLACRRAPGCAGTVSAGDRTIAYRLEPGATTRVRAGRAKATVTNPPQRPLSVR